MKPIIKALHFPGGRQNIERNQRTDVFPPAARDERLRDFAARLPVGIAPRGLALLPVNEGCDGQPVPEAGGMPRGVFRRPAPYRTDRILGDASAKSERRRRSALVGGFIPQLDRTPVLRSAGGRADEADARPGTLPGDSTPWPKNKIHSDSNCSHGQLTIGRVDSVVEPTTIFSRPDA